MKLLPSPISVRNAMRSDDTLMQGVEGALVVIMFLGVGYGLDRWLGTRPWLTISVFLLGVLGLFFSWRAKYMNRMEELEAQRRSELSEHRRQPTAGPVPGAVNKVSSS